MFGWWKIKWKVNPEIVCWEGNVFSEDDSYMLFYCYYSCAKFLPKVVCNVERGDDLNDLFEFIHTWIKDLCNSDCRCCIYSSTNQTLNIYRRVNIFHCEEKHFNLMHSLKDNYIEAGVVTEALRDELDAFALFSAILMNLNVVTIH